MEQEQKNDFILKGSKTNERNRRGQSCLVQFTKRAGVSKRNNLQKWHAEPALTWCHIPNHKGTNRPDMFAACGGCIRKQDRAFSFVLFCICDSTCLVKSSFHSQILLVLPCPKKIQMGRLEICVRNSREPPASAPSVIVLAIRHLYTPLLPPYSFLKLSSCLVYFITIFVRIGYLE